MDTMILTLALSLIRAIVKNPAKKRALRAALLNLRDAIDAAFASPES